ncbi:MAG: hypothetical protein JWO52_4087 [Gammaproteobacteria bacterium]|nr:hypothetical protein [Gammaproteobacteria bacterium]
MNATTTPTCDWTPPEQLEAMLTMAITQVRSAEVPPDVLAKTIMVAIRTEVARSREEVVRSVADAMRGASKP